MASLPHSEFPVPRRGARRRLWLAVLLIGSTLCAVLLAELGCRVHGSFKAGNGPSRFIEHDAELGWRNRPGFVGRHVSQDFAIDVCIDGQGCRVAPGETVRSARIWAVGDSNTFGWGVQVQSTWVEQLARRLGQPIRNHGVSGYGPGQQLLRMQWAWARGERPELVIVLHSTNDLVEAGSTRIYRSYKPQCVLVEGELELRGVPLPFDLAKHSYLWRTIAKRLGSEPGVEGPDAAVEPGVTAVRRRLVAAAYRRMHRECRALGAQLVLVGLDADWLRPVAAELGVAYVDLRPAVGRVGAGFRFAHDPHWLPSAHTEIAAELEPVVRRVRGVR